MFTIDVPGLMMIFASALMAYLIMCFVMGMVAAMYIHFRYLFHPESIEPYLRLIALKNPQKYQDYIDYFDINDERQTKKPIIPQVNNIINTNEYVGED
jgi:hypothetical protein